jgi:hypothetical protein
MQVEIAVDLVDQDDGETQETVLEPVPDLDDSGLTNNMAPPAACKGLSTCVYVKETSMILELFLFLWFEFLDSLVLLHLYCSPA